jgi:mono/diheme cytochrome c family protein
MSMRRSSPLACVLAAAMVAGVLAACGTGRRVDPPLALSSAGQDSELAHGQRVFMRACHQCHPRGETGLGPALNNKYVPAFLIRFQVRNGLGAMPAFPASALSTEELDAVVRYIQYLQYDVPAPPA